jgi:nucleoid-associated protein YgaU
MSLLRNSLAVAAAVAIVTTTVLLMPPLENRPLPTAPGAKGKEGGAKAAPEKAEMTAATTGREDQPGEAPSVQPPLAARADAPPKSPGAFQDQPPVSAPSQAARGTDPSGPAGQDYVVKGGDTPATIAREHLGDASRWTEIARLNPGLDAKSLKIGQTLKLPGGAAASTAGAQAAVTAKKPGAAPEAPASSGEPLAVHRIGQGDTLYKLAQKYYGDASRWKLIQDANPTVTGGVSAMRLDSELIIPALPGPGR